MGRWAIDTLPRYLRPWTQELRFYQLGSYWPEFRGARSSNASVNTGQSSQFVADRLFSWQISSISPPGPKLGGLETRWQQFQATFVSQSQKTPEWFFIFATIAPYRFQKVQSHMSSINWRHTSKYTTTKTGRARGRKAGALKWGCDRDIFFFSGFKILFRPWYFINLRVFSFVQEKRNTLAELSCRA